jgi:signal transduction histidine kinase
VEYSHSNGTGPRWYNVLISPVSEGRNDETKGLVAILRDVTRDKDAAKMKTDFVANAAHELRTPLGGIKAYLEMLMDGEVSDHQTRDKFYGVMQDEVNRLSNLIENILNISRIEAGIVRVSKEPVPLTVAVK